MLRTVDLYMSAHRDRSVNNDTTLTQRVRDFVHRRGQVRAQEVEEAGLPRRALYRLRDRGEIVQVGPGLFQDPDFQVGEEQPFVEAAKLVPRGVICLLSALVFHEIGTQLPRQTWMALDRANRRKPRIPDLPLQFVWFSGEAFTAGQEVRYIGNTELRVYSPAKTIADLFKYRRKVGLDVALEALNEGWSMRRFKLGELQRFAEICDVKNVMKPYLQSLTV